MKMNQFRYVYPMYDNEDADTLTIYEYSTDFLKFFIAIDSLKRGAAVGACRFINDTPREVALNEVCKMARTMTQKNIIAGLPFGGGKSFIFHSRLPKEEALQIFSQALNELNGIYYTTNDIGTTLDDMDYIRKYSPFAKGVKYQGEPIPATAYGVLLAMQTASKFVFGTEDLKGRSVSIQGLGNVGMPLLAFLHERGCRIIVDDIDEGKVSYAKQCYNVEIADKDFVTCDVDIVAPCANGSVINEANVDKVKAKLIVGGANNQLSSDIIGEILHNKGIMFVPDMLANYGGMIDLFCEGPLYCEKYVFDHIDPIKERVKQMILGAKSNNESILSYLNRWVKEEIMA